MFALCRYLYDIEDMHRGMTNTMTMLTSGLLTMFLVSGLIICTSSAWPIGNTAHSAPSTPMDASKSAFGDVIQPTVWYPAGETEKTSSMDASKSAFGDVIKPTVWNLAGETEKTSSVDASYSAFGDVIQPSSSEDPGISKVDISWEQLEALLRSLKVRHYREKLKKLKKFRSPMFIGK